jgi:RimJ/RimL family protein N-acetyltransferase
MDTRSPSASTSAVLLRDVTQDDLAIFFEQQLDQVATQMAAFPARDRQAFMAHWAKVLVDETVITQTVLFDGHVAGNVVSFELSGTRNVGYWIGRRYWGKGIATTALAAFLDQVQARPLYAHVAKHNPASLRVLEKCGFTIFGEDRVDLDTNGEQIEEYLLKLSATEQRP